jgi:hypothetical protein
MNRWYLFLLSLSQLLVFENLSWAQDEKIYRQLVSGEILTNLETLQPPAAYEFKAPYYAFDLNGDQLEEYLSYEIRDGIPYFQLFNQNKTLLLEGKLSPTGAHAKPYRFRIVDLSQKFRVVIIYFNEGETTAYGYHQFSRLYFLSIDDKKLNQAKIVKGPQIFQEKEIHREQYFRRQYGVNVVDFNQDGIKEISVSYHGHERIYKYLGLGKWEIY